MLRRPSRGYSSRTRQTAVRQAVGAAPVIPTTNIQRQQPRPQAQNFGPLDPPRSVGQQPAAGSIGLASGVPANAGMTAPSGLFRPDRNGTRPRGGGRRADDGLTYEAGEDPNGTTNGAAGNSSEVYVETDDMFEKLMRDLMGDGPRDTSEDEALINEMMRANTGQGQADLMAGMAAGGFGMGGAAQAGMGDIATRAARSAAGEVMDVRQGARDEWLERVNTGMEGYFGDRGLDQSDRGMDIDEEFRDRELDLTEEQWDQYMQALEKIYGDIPTPEEQQEIDDSAATNAEMDDIDQVVGGLTGGNDPPPDAANYNEWTGSDPPLGLRTGRDDQYIYVFGLDGKLWKVPAAMYQGS